MPNSLRLLAPILLFFFLRAVPLAAQNQLQEEITATFHHRSLPEMLYQMENQYGLKFFYYPDRLPVYRQSFEFLRAPLYSVLNEILAGSELAFLRYGERGIVLIPRQRRDKEYADELVRQWEAGEISLQLSDEAQVVRLVLGDSTQTPPPGRQFVLEGTITEAATGRPAIGATIGRPGTPYGEATDENGRYRIELPAGRRQLEVQYIGYQPVVVELGLFAGGRLDLALEVRPLSLGEIVVEAQASDNNVSSTQTGLEQLSVRTIRELPAFLGEADVVKSLMLLPGVSTVGEGAGGFNVRGGNIDQNLIVQDGAPLYNSSHALGFFSIFNTDAIRNVTLYKGNIPAQYGGRTSSVLDVDVREGDYDRFQGRGGVGIVTSRLLLEGPLAKGRTSFLVGGRASYSDWVLKLAEQPDLRNSSSYFYDGTAKLSHRLGERSRVSLSGFWSYDYFRYAQEFGFNWRNLLFSGQWQQSLSPRLSSTFTAVSGDYANRQFDPSGNDAFDLYGGIRYCRLSEQLVFTPNSHTLRAGVDWLRQIVAPERIGPAGAASTVAPREVAKDRGQEWGIYLNDEWEISPALALSVGLRYSFFQNYGPRTVFLYRSGTPREDFNIVDTLTYGAGELITDYGGLEPRLGLRYRLSPTRSVKAGYNRLRQYVHLISNSTAATPVDIWQLSNPHLPPQVADNYSLGFFQNFADNAWEFSAEGFYRDIRNLVEYQDLPDLLLNEHLETELLSGRGRAYGVEVSLKKNAGEWTGWLAYTFSRSQQQVESEFPQETVNQGAWFPTAFDQPHQVSLVSRWQWNPKNSFTCNFIYRTGRPVTAPEGGYQLGQTYVPHYSPRNAYRIGDYHRLDVAYTFDNTQGRSKGFRGSLTIAIYNLYFRENPFSFYFKGDSRGVSQAYQLSVLGTAFPSITYNFLF